MLSANKLSDWTGYVVLSETILTDFIKKSFWNCRLSDLDDDEKALKRLIEFRETNQNLISGSDWKDLLQRIEHMGQLEWVYSRLYQHFGGDFCWHSDVWYTVDDRYQEINKKKKITTLEVNVRIKIDSVAFSDSGKDEMSLGIAFTISADREELIKAIQGELKGNDKKEQDEMKRLLETPGGSNGLNETQKSWIHSWLEVKIFQECAPQEIIDDIISQDEDYIFLNRTSNIKVKCSLNIDDYPFDTNNLHFFLINLHSRSTEEITLQIDQDDDLWNGFGIGAWANPRGFRIERLILSEADNAEAYNAPVKICVLDQGPREYKSHAFEFGFAVTRNPGSVILRTIIPGIIIMFTGLVTGLWAWIDPSHSDSVVTSVMPGVLIAVIALQITAAQSIPQNSGSTRVDKFFLFNYFSVLFMILALIAPRWIGSLFLAASLGSIVYGVDIMFKNNWRTALNSLIRS